MEEPKSPIHKILMHEATTAVTIFMAGISFMLWISNTFNSPMYQMQKDIALMRQSVDNINQNHEVHIQDILADIKELKQKDISQDSKYEVVGEKLARILTILDRYFK